MNKKKIRTTLSSFSGGIWRAIGFFLLAPLIYTIYSYFANTGNTDNLQYLKTYINDSEIVQIKLPSNREQIEKKYVTNYRDQHNNLIYYFTVSFYDAKIKKYIAICMFEGIDFFNQEKRGGDLGAARIKSYFNPGNIFLVHVNKTQLHDSKYGTKENPVPVFWYKFISGTVERQIKKDNTPYDRSTKSIPYFDVQDNLTTEEYKLFVSEYLIRILNKEELKRLYENEVHIDS